MGLTLKTKRRLTFVAQSIFFLFGGIEYAVVLPTLNAYLGHLDGDATFFGIVMASFSFSGVLVSPLFGLVQDRFKRTKVLILFANLWEIGGNFLYFVGGSKYILLGSRLISGVGSGVGSSVYAQISLTSTEKDRTVTLSVAAGARQIGILLGPAFNLPLNNCDFYIGPFHVNNFSGPGILMCVLFIFLEVTIFFCYYDIPLLNEQAETEDPGQAIAPAAVRSNSYEREQELVTSRGNKVGNLYEARDLCAVTSSEELNGGSVRQPDHDNAIKNSVEVRPGGIEETEKFSRLDVFLKEEVLVLLTAQFVFTFIQTCLETCLTVMTKRLLDFGGVANSIMFAVAGLEVLVSYVIIKFISKFISDRVMFLSSLTVEIVPLILLSIFYLHATPGRDKNLWWFSTLFVFQISGGAFFYVSILSLFTKVTPPAMQGVTQGIRRAVGGVGTIMGPFWAGTVGHWPFEMFAVMIALLVILWGLFFSWLFCKQIVGICKFHLKLLYTIIHILTGNEGMSVLSWKRLRPHSDIAAAPCGAITRDDVNEETKPLLAETDLSDYGVA